jgi:acyl-[acyl-carrier-protein]-phospholipid O-acyltransferase/long-chain-fatty-acid--[acyl-carrier-protein] ligase
MLNFTAGSRNLVSAVKTGPLPVVVTSRRFVETAKLEDVLAAISETELAPGRRVRVLYLEDVRKRIGAIAKLTGLARSKSAAATHRRHRLAPHKPAVILFTSGTEGAPKGVALSNVNLVANALQIFAHAGGMLTPADTAFNPLPMFHSFGLTAGTTMPLLNGLKVVLYPSPLHYKQVPKLIRDTRATVLFATDTFLQGYARAADPDDLKSVRFVIAGAERVKDATRDMWSAHGALILEGYGATECSPVIACNLPATNRPGTVGGVLPGIEARLDPVEGISEGGRLVVSGPNVMAGYVLADKPGVIVPPPGGWHDTGDIVTIEDGLVSIRGRAKRFAKIGGEMVSLAAVEALVSSLWPESSHVALSIPDPKKGETLVLVTDAAHAAKDALLAHARAAGFAELWVPKTVIVVPQIPILGSGKVDLPATLDIVRQHRAVV